jgi:hypothetical protein
MMTKNLLKLSVGLSLLISANGAVEGGILAQCPAIKDVSELIKEEEGQVMFSDDLINGFSAHLYYPSSWKVTSTKMSASILGNQLFCKYPLGPYSKINLIKHLKSCDDGRLSFSDETYEPACKKEKNCTVYCYREKK